MIKEIRMPLSEYEQLKEIEKRYKEEKGNYVHNHIVTVRLICGFDIRQYKFESQFSASMPEEIKSMFDDNIERANGRIESMYREKYYNIPKWIRNMFA